MQHAMSKPDSEMLPGERTLWSDAGAGIDFLSELVASFAGYFMLSASLIIVLETILRTFFKAPTIWSFDLTGYLMVWFGFCAAAYGIKQGSHINVDIIVMNMKPRTKIPLDIISCGLSVAFSTILFVYIFQVCLGHFKSMEAAPTAWGFPVYAVELGVVIGR